MTKDQQCEQLKVQWCHINVRLCVSSHKRILIFVIIRFLFGYNVIDQSEFYTEYFLFTK